jgi:TetR/AcrR family transcriptional repressor of mexCD-oprJ operon
MDEVAGAAGISRATLNRQFAGRDALVRALEELGLAECERAVEKAGVDVGPACDAVRRLVRELEPAAGLLAFLYSENQLFEGDGQNDGWARLDVRTVALFRRSQEAQRVPDRPQPGLVERGALRIAGLRGLGPLEGRVAPKDFTLLLGGLLRGQTPGTHEQ